MTRIRNSCLYGIKRTGDTRFVKDAIGTAIESCRNNMIKMPQANGTPPVFPKTCPLGCSGNGKCETGVCKCKVGYGNSDCSIETTKQPAFMSVEPRSTCDVRKRNCSVLLINGENLRDKPECVFEEIKVFTDKPFERTGTVTRLPATYDNNNQVYCHGNQPPKPGIYHPIPKDPSTNTWLHAGPVYMPFDSLCFDCNIGALTCKPKKSSCYVDGKCYAAGKGVGGKTGCYVCDPTVASDKLVASKDEKACQLPTASAHGSHKETKEIGPMWWILLILLGLLLLCFAVLCCILCCFCGKNRGRYTHHERKEVFENMKANSIFAGMRCSEKPAEDDEFNATFVHEDEVVLAERNHSESMIGHQDEETMAADDWSATISGVDLEEEGGEYNATFVHEDEVVAAERQHVESMIGRHQERTMTVNDGSATLEEEGGEYNAALVFEDEVVVAERQHVESGATLEEDVMAASVGCVAPEPPQPYHGLLVHEQTQVVIKQKNKSMSFFGHGGFARSSLHLKPGGPARSSLRLQVPDEDAKGLCNDQTSLEGQATREEKGSPCLNVSDHIELDDFSADHLDQGDKEHSYIAFSHGFPHDAPAIVGDHWHEWEEGEIIQEMEFGSEFGSRASTPCDYVQGAEVSEETNQVSTYHLGLSQNHQANIHHDGTLRICRSPTPTFVVTAPEEESGLYVPSPRPCDGSRQPSPGPFDGSRGPSPRIYTSNTMYTDGGASESTFDSSAHHATSIYEANIDTEHEGVEDQDVRTSKPVHVLQNKKVYLGALVQGKLLNKAQHDQPLHDEYDRPDDMNINPLFDDDDGVQQGYAYVSTSQANPQVDGHHAQYVTPSYGADAKMYTRQKVTHPLETLFIDTRQKLVSPQSPELIRTVSPPTVFTKSTLVVDTPTESVDVDSPSSPRKFVAHSYVTTSSRPATPGSATYSMESRRTVPSDHSTELKNDEYYFVDSEALETLNIPDESVEDYVYANRGELVGTQQSET
ncbi:uncharacterized protein LOC135489826 [Lineus longissimus]|uniref:uncharacterized protein LOC135489826 n=1 Tax=Lineus longissimus TaxID=88925 RepID=UPI00315D02C5